MNGDTYRAQLQASMQQFGLPRHAWDSLIEYIVIGRPVGDFLAAVLTNDLMRAATRADVLNLPRLPDYALFLKNVAPATCYGSPAAVQEWMRLGGVLGRQQRMEATKRLRDEAAGESSVE